MRRLWYTFLDTGIKNPLQFSIVYAGRLSLYLDGMQQKWWDEFAAPRCLIARHFVNMEYVRMTLCRLRFTIFATNQTTNVGSERLCLTNK